LVKQLNCLIKAVRIVGSVKLSFDDSVVHNSMWRKYISKVLPLDALGVFNE
jgi:hypothetical protein